MNDYTAYYYNNIGCSKSDEETSSIDNFFGYLEDANVSKEKIISFIEHITCDISLNLENIPDIFYEDSLLSPKEKYYHNELKIISAPAVIDSSLSIKEDKFYIENKIVYKEIDIVNYFYKNMDKSHALFRDDKKDIGAVNYLLNKKYNLLTLCSPVDFILYMIDYCKEYKIKPNSIIDIDNYCQQAYSYIEKKIRYLAMIGRDIVIWRS